MQEEKSFDFPPKVLYENRYCYQDDFSVLICGGKNKNDKIVNTVYKLDGSKLECEKYSGMPRERYSCKTAVINSELFIMRGYLRNKKFDNYIMKFCSKTKTWSYETETNVKNKYFCTCSFKKNLYVINEDSSSFAYNFKSRKWTEVAETNQRRCDSS